MHHTEDRGVCTNPQCQGERRHAMEGRRSGEHAYSVVNILHRLLDEAQPSLVTAGLFDRFDTAERHASSSAGFTR